VAERSGASLHVDASDGRYSSGGARGCVGVAVVYRLVAGRRDESMLERLADGFMEFVIERGQRAVAAYVEPRTAQQVRACRRRVHPALQVRPVARPFRA